MENKSPQTIVNVNNAFEGGGIPPKAQGGRRIPSVTNFTIINNQSVVGGGILTLTWLQEEVGTKDFLKINVFATANFLDPFSSNTLDILASNTTINSLSTEYIVRASPAQIFIPASKITPVTVTISTQHSSGITSLDSFNPSVSAVINPINKYISRKSADFDVHKSDPYLYVVDTSSISIVANLPPIAEVIQGFCQGIKCVGSSGVNNITLTPAGSDTVNGALALNFGIPYTMWIYADKENSDWITTPTA